MALRAAKPMQGRKPVSIACSLLMAGAASVGSAADAPMHAVTRVAQLPAEVVSVLEEMGPISDPGGPFNPSDVVDVDHPVPGQRLVSGQAGPDFIVLTVEKGGRGYAHAVLQFSRVDGHWQLVGQKHVLPDGQR
jgi:hypothetical protein